MSKESRPNRRGFLKSLSLAGAAFIFLPRRGMGISLDSLGNKMSLPEAAQNMIQLNLQDAKYRALAKTGSAVYVDAEGEKNPIIVSRLSKDKVVALSSTCTHKGCRLNLPQKGKIVCPCHRAVFGQDGKVIKGPTRTDLKVYPAEIVEEMISIRMK